MYRLIKIVDRVRIPAPTPYKTAAAAQNAGEEWLFEARATRTDGATNLELGFAVERIERPRLFIVHDG